MSLSLAGLASGFDWRSVVDQLADIEERRNAVFALSSLSSGLEVQLTQVSKRS